MKIRLKNKWATHTSTGIVSKGIYEINGKDYLVKGNSGVGKYEPISEALVSIILKNLNINQKEFVKYEVYESSNFQEVKDNKLGFVCACEKLNFNIYQFHNTIKILINKDYFDPFREYLKYPTLSVDFLFRLLLIDAFVGNKDRHWNNLDIRYSENGEFINAPMLDFGASLLYDLKSYELKEYTGEQIGPDSCKPFADTHKKQIHRVKKCVSNTKVFEYVNKEEFFSNFKQEAKEILDLLPEKRQKAILSYLWQRWDYYIEPYMKLNTELDWID